LNLKTSAGKRTARFLLAGACDSYVLLVCYILYMHAGGVCVCCADCVICCRRMRSMTVPVTREMRDDSVACACRDVIIHRIASPQLCSSFCTPTNVTPLTRLIGDHHAFLMSA